MATAARCSRDSRPPTRQWVFYTDGDGAVRPRRARAAGAARVRRRRRGAGLQAAPRRRSVLRAVIGPRVPPLRVVVLRAEDPRHRLRLPADPPRHARPGDARAHDRCHLRRARAQAAGHRRAVHRGRCAPLPPRPRQVGVLPGGADRCARCGASPGSGSQLVVLRRGRTPGTRSAGSEQDDRRPEREVVVREP